MTFRCIDSWGVSLSQNQAENLGTLQEGSLEDDFPVKLARGMPWLGVHVGFLPGQVMASEPNRWCVHSAGARR